MSTVAAALLKERDEAYAERDLHIRANALLEQEIEKLRGVLEFYASSSLYDYDGNPDCCSPIERDAGRKAMIALGYITPEGNPK